MALNHTTKPLKSCVIIGGGIAGSAIARVLSERGVETTLLEKSGQLTSGATWHAAGLVTRFAGSSKVKKVHVRALNLLTDLHNEHDIGLHLPGSIRLIEKNNEGRLYEAKQHVAMATLFDDEEFPTKMIDIDEIKEKHPLVNTDNIECAIWTPSDGDIDPTSLTNCVAKLARQHGTKIKFNQEVNAIERTSKNGTNTFTIKTTTGKYLSEGAAREWSTVVDISITHPSFKRVPWSSPRSPLSKTPKQVFF